MDKKLLDMLACPVSRGALIHDPRREELISPQAGLAYPIRDQVPVLLESEARPLTEQEREKYRQKPR